MIFRIVHRMAMHLLSGSHLLILVGKAMLPVHQGRQVMKILRLLIKKDWPVLSKLKIKPEYEKDLEKISEDYLSYFSST